MKRPFSEVCLKLSGYLLTIIISAFAGAFMTYHYQIKNSQREEAQNTITLTSLLITKRMYQLQRVNLALKTPNIGDAENFFKNYREDGLPSWNIHASTYYYQIERYFGKKLADKLTTPNNPEPKPDALIVYFKNANKFTEDWKTCVVNNKSNVKSTYCVIEQKNADASMGELLKAGTEYIDQLNKAFLHKYES